MTGEGHALQRSREQAEPPPRANTDVDPARARAASVRAAIAALVTAAALAAVALASEADAPRLGFLMWFRHEGRGVAAEGTAVLVAFAIALALSVGAFASGGLVRWPAAAAAVAVRLSLAASVMFMLAFPSLPQFDGKSLTARAIAYPVLSSIIPAVWLLRRGRVAYPAFADVCWTLALTVDIVGNDLHWYGNWKHWDDTVHFLNSLPVMFLLIAGLLVLERRGVMRIGIAGAALFALALYTSLHGVWETSEYLSDRYLGTELQPGGMEEATRNNLSAALGSMLAIALACWWWQSGMLERAFVGPAASFVSARRDGGDGASVRAIPRERESRLRAR